VEGGEGKVISRGTKFFSGSSLNHIILEVWKLWLPPSASFSSSRDLLFWFERSGWYFGNLEERRWLHTAAQDMNWGYPPAAPQSMQLVGTKDRNALLNF